MKSTLKKMNIAGAAVHFSLGCAIMIYAIVKKSRVKVQLSKWTAKDSDNELCEDGCSPMQKWGNVPVGPKMNLVAFPVIFELITAGFHVFYAFSPKYNSSVFGSSRNPYRFIEYAITSTIMLVNLRLLSYLRNGFQMFSVIFGSIMTNLVALVAETMDNKTQMVEKVLLFVCASFPFVINWTQFVDHFPQIVNTGRCIGEEIPNWVNYSIWGSLICYLSFPVIFWVQQFHLKDYWKGEYAFVIMSFTSKVFLAGMCFYGLIRQRALPDSIYN
jgi:hypothetical protein